MKPHQNAYKMGDLSAESYNALVMRMKEDRYLFDSYFKLGITFTMQYNYEQDYSGINFYYIYQV